jgi:hypothetical protein
VFGEKGSKLILLKSLLSILISKRVHNQRYLSGLVHYHPPKQGMYCPVTHSKYKIRQYLLATLKY